MEGSHLALFLIDTMSGLVAYWDRDLLCRFANSAYLTWFGKQQKSIIGHRAQDVLGDDIYTRDEPHIFAALSGERRQFERRAVRPDGSIGHTLVCYIPDIAHGEVIGFIAHITEITELKETEATLQLETEARTQAHALLGATATRLEEAQRLGQVGSWEWQYETDVLVWSRELYRLFGLNPSASPKRHAGLQNLFAAESWQRLEAAMKRAIRTGEPYVLELHFNRADAIWKPPCAPPRMSSAEPAASPTSAAGRSIWLTARSCGPSRSAACTGWSPAMRPRSTRRCNSSPPPGAP
jgi:PAS domain S-box-containing protein